MAHMHGQPYIGQFDPTWIDTVTPSHNPMGRPWDRHHMDRLLQSPPPSSRANFHRLHTESYEHAAISNVIVPEAQIPETHEPARPSMSLIMFSTPFSAKHTSNVCWTWSAMIQPA
jgi:hypothetical protein